MALIISCPPEEFQAQCCLSCRHDTVELELTETQTMGLRLLGVFLMTSLPRSDGSDPTGDGPQVWSPSLQQNMLKGDVLEWKVLQGQRTWMSWIQYSMSGQASAG